MTRSMSASFCSLAPTRTVFVRTSGTARTSCVAPVGSPPPPWFCWGIQKGWQLPRPPRPPCWFWFVGVSEKTSLTSFATDVASAKRSG